MMAYVYGEKTLQLAAIGWMKRQWGYHELDSDEEAHGERMDSIGLLHGEIIAIEVKTAIHSGMSFFRKDGSGSIEAKINETVRKLRNGESGKQVNVIREHWNKAPPHVAIITGKFAARGRGELEEMLKSRSIEWGFRFSIFLWNGHDLQVCVTGPETSAFQGRNYDKIEIPQQKGMSVRKGTKALKNLYETGQSAGLDDVLPSFVAIAKSKGFRIKRGGNCITLSRPDLIGNRAVVTVFLDGAHADLGFNVGVGADRLGISAGVLFSNIAPRQGYLNTNLYIRDVAQFSSLLALVEASSNTPSNALPTP